MGLMGAETVEEVGEGEGWGRLRMEMLKGNMVEEGKAGLQDKETLGFPPGNVDWRDVVAGCRARWRMIAPPSRPNG